MGNALAAGLGGKERGHGRSWGVVCADWGSEHSASPLAIREFGRAEGEERNVLGSGGVGRYGAQDCAVDSVDEVEDSGSYALESCGLGGRDTETQRGWQSCRVVRKASMYQ